MTRLCCFWRKRFYLAPNNESYLGKFSRLGQIRTSQPARVDETACSELLVRARASYGWQSLQRHFRASGMKKLLCSP